MARVRDDDDVDLGSAAPRSDVYTGLLAIALGAMITGCMLLYLDYSEYPDKKPEPYAPPAVKGTPNVPAPGAGAPKAGPGGPPAAAPGAPPGGPPAAK